MKPALLFLVILVAFSGCRKVEKQQGEPKNVHEINIGILGGTGDSSNGNVIYGFMQYWHLNLLNDSFYVKNNAAFLGAQETSLKVGRFALRNTEVINRFLKEIKVLKDGQKFLHHSSGTEFFCVPIYIIQYKENNTAKLLFFNDNNFVLKNLIELVQGLASQNKLVQLPYSKNINDDSLINHLVNRPDFDSIAPPLMVQKTIKFSPPVRK